MSRKSPDTQQHSLFVYQLHDFVQSLQHYFLADVVGDYWEIFIKNVQNAQTFDDVYKVHSSFIECVSLDCMLTDPALVTPLNVLLECCGTYCSMFLVIS